MAVVNLVVTVLVAPRALPRLDFSKGIPSDHRTMVVIPTILTSMRDVTALVEGLEVRYLGNRDPNLWFALLTDFPDAPAATQPDDDDLLRLARGAITSLNEKYGSEGRTVFYLFHRPRVWNPHERLWMGYERKRGKLEQFNALLRGGPRDAFAATSATRPSCSPSSTSSRWIPIPRCRAMRPASSWARWLTR